jgi:hypothetical protein
LKSSSSSVPRSPQFLVGARATVAEATFGSRGSLTGQRRVVPLLDMPPNPRSIQRTDQRTEMSAGIEPLAPPLPPPPPQPGPEFAARLAQAVSDLRAESVRIGEQTEADVVEIAVVIARRILEKELETGTAALFSLVRTAVRRLGETRKIVVRLCPSDAAAVEAAAGSGPLTGLAIVKVELLADATLSPGDCIVDGEHGTVDGRLATRLDEVRRIVNSALAEPPEQP